MKASDIRELGTEERLLKIAEFKQELFNLRFQHGSGQLENPQRMKVVKRDIARIHTIIREDAGKE